MTLVEACEPLFQYVCRLNRSARKGGDVDMAQTRAELKTLLGECKTRALTTGKGSSENWDKIEIVLLYFVDFMVRESQLPWVKDWRDLAHERNKTAGDEDFFDELDKALADPSESASERLRVFYTCMGLGFTGWFAGDSAKLRQYMNQMASRLRGQIDNDRAAKVCPEAYEHVNTSDLVEPPGRKLFGLVIVLVGLGITVLVANVVALQSMRSEMESSLSALTKKDTSGPGTSSPNNGPGTSGAAAGGGAK